MLTYLITKRQAMGSGAMEIIMALPQVPRGAGALTQSRLIVGVVMVACIAKLALYVAGTQQMLAAQTVGMTDLALQGILCTTLLIMVWKAVRSLALDVRGAWMTS